MNIFFLSRNPVLAAQYHNDKHIVKMILESAQLLSTAHRVLDGTLGHRLSQSGAKLKDWILPDARQDLLYKATHVNHPCAIWCRATSGNYRWLYDLFIELGKEYSYRYAGKTHLSIIKLADVLNELPYTIPVADFYDPPQAMPDECKDEDAVTAYRNYYIIHKSEISVWTKREKPHWYVTI